MKKIALSFALMLSCVLPQKSHALIVHDPITMAAEVAKLLETISVLQNQYRALLHQGQLMEKNITNLGRQSMARWLADYRAQFEQLMTSVNGYPGLMQQIGRLDEIFPRLDLQYPGTPEMTPADHDKMGPMYKIMKKQMLISRQQMKHALKVGAKVLEEVPQTQAQIEVGLENSRGAVGILQATQAGNEVLGILGKSLQTLSVQLGTFVQAYSTRELQAQGTEAVKMRRVFDATKDWAEPFDSPKFDPLRIR